MTTGDTSGKSLTVISSPTAIIAPPSTIVIRANQPIIAESSAEHTTPLLAAPTVSDEKRLEEMFSRTFQQEQEEMNSKNYRPKDTLTEKVKALVETKDVGVKQSAPVEEEGVCVCVCCLLYTSPSPRDATLSRMPSSA